MPKFSVIIPTYNVEIYIEECLSSVINQTYTDYEIVIVDDSSDDKTVKIINKIINENEDIKIKFFMNKVNMGVSYSRNKAIYESEGEYIVILDSDDYLLNNRLKIMNDYLLLYNADILFDNLLYFYESKASYTDLYTLKEIRIEEISKLEIEDFILKDLGYLKGVIRRKILLENNIFYNQDIQVGEDFLFYIRIFINDANVYLIPESLYMYRQRRKSLSNNMNEKNFIDRINSTKQILEYINTEYNSDNKIKIALTKRIETQYSQYNFFKLSKLIKKKKYKNSFLYILKNPSIIKTLLRTLIDRRKN